MALYIVWDIEFKSEVRVDQFLQKHNVKCFSEFSLGLFPSFSHLTSADNNSKEEEYNSIDSDQPPTRIKATHTASHKTKRKRERERQRNHIEKEKRAQKENKQTNKHHGNVPSDGAAAVSERYL